MTVRSQNTGGVKRKRHVRDDGVRVPVIQQTYLFDEIVAGMGNRSNEFLSSPTYLAKQGATGSAYSSCNAKLSGSTPDRSAFAASRREYSAPLAPSSTRLEYRALALCNQGGKRGSSTYSSRSSVDAQDSSATLCDAQSKSTLNPMSRRFPSTTRPSLTPSRSSPSTSLLPAHLRPSVADQDSLSAERFASSLRLLATWESIALKYADVDPEDDAEIDIATGRIVRGKEKIAEMPDRVIGGMSEDEEAEELGRRGKKSIAKSANLEPQCFPVRDPAEQAIHSVQSPPFDAEESDPSDMDELDTWNESELEIQIEALPPSYTSKSRNQRPWTADDDIDLKEFLKAEERRRAMFGEEETTEEIEEEEASNHQVSRVMDKEEAMSRRTVHASVPYFPPAVSSHLPRSTYRSKDAVFNSSKAGFFAPTTSCHQSVLLEDVGSDEDHSSAEDELAGMFETPGPLEKKRLPCGYAAASPSLSSVLPNFRSTEALRHSSPSSASSYLNRQSTEGFSSSGEGEVFQMDRTSPHACRRAVLRDEDICERELFDISSDSRYPETGYDPDHPHRHAVKDGSTSSDARLQEDEARCSLKSLVEVVIEVPILSYSEPKGNLALPEVARAALEVRRETNIVPGPRRSSRHAPGKSYTFLNKRTRRTSSTAQVLECNDDNDSDAGAHNARDSQRGSKISSRSPPAPVVVNSDLQDQLKAHDIQPTIAREDARSPRPDPRTRSPSVVEGTPEPTPITSCLGELDETSVHCLLKDVADSVVRDVPLFSTAMKPLRTSLDVGLHQEELDIQEPVDPNCIKDLESRRCSTALPFSNAIPQIAHNKGHADSIQQVSTSASLEFDSVTSLKVTSTISSAMLDDSGDTVESQGLQFQGNKGTENLGRNIQAHMPEVEDEDDILLLGATFVEGEEIIWPESKPDIGLPSTASAASHESLITPYSTSFRSVKGEKEEQSTFTAPFRCSRIIDLTGDDICGEDEHDELDEW